MSTGDGLPTTVAAVASDAVVSVQSEKVTFGCKKLERKLRAAIGHAHEAEQF
jgi:hypothetical protein